MVLMSIAVRREINLRGEGGRGEGRGGEGGGYEHQSATSRKGLS